MKLSRIIGSVLLAAALSACVSEKKSQAQISKEEATATALAKVPGGVVKEGELEKEHGKLIWSFDIATAGTKDITEVQVDAINGSIVSVTHESAAAEAKEKD